MKALAASFLAVLFVSAGMATPVTLDQRRTENLLSLKYLDGRPLSANQVVGKPVIVSFFASWCLPCNTEFEYLSLLHQSHAADGLTIVAVNLFEDFSGFQDNGQRLKRFLDRHQPVFTILKGTSETAKLFGDVKRLPTVFVFDRQGRPQLHFVHAKNAKKTNPGMDELRGAVRDAMGVGAARKPPSLPEPAVSVTKRSSSRKLAEIQP
jgi:cytochrome c biogenesis protein CcmG/thiol:disulfide interchange protein DsbE